MPRSGTPLSVPPLVRRRPGRAADPGGSPPDAAAPVDFEALFGGRVLAWIGGLAILVGAVLFLVMAISRGWLDEEARTIIAAVVSLAALVGGIWLHERQGRTEAARALVAAAISGLFGTIVVATQAYSLISPGLGLALRRRGRGGRLRDRGPLALARSSPRSARSARWGCRS